MLTSASNISFIHRVMAIIIHSSWFELSKEKSDVVVLSWFGALLGKEKNKLGSCSVSERGS